MTRTVAPCGTEGAYHRHRYYGEKPCDACKAAHWARERVRDQVRRPPGSRAVPGAKIGRPVTQPCGTMAGYNRHRYRGEEVCEPCRAAEREREAARPKRPQAEKLAGRKTPLQPCGTTAARQRHWKRNETCWVCWTGDVS